MLALYGHAFSSYTWKALIALYANETPFELREVSPEHPDNGAFLAAQAGPWGKFPALVDGEVTIFESTSIIEYLSLHHAGYATLIAEDPDAAIGMRMLDRTFDNYVMAPVQAVVEEHIRNAEHPDAARCREAREKLARSYQWLEKWLRYYPVGGQISLVECAAAPALFYAHWVHPIGAEFPRLAAWRRHLLSLPAVARCVEEARPFRPYFPVPHVEED
jgi:glutathione S-transferase